jgi:hypothetical protein
MNDGNVGFVVNGGGKFGGVGVGVMPFAKHSGPGMAEIAHFVFGAEHVAKKGGVAL